MWTEARYCELIGRIYEAAALPELWPSALDLVADSFGASCAHLFDWDDIAGGPTFDAVSNNYLGQERYQAEYGRIDPRRELMRRHAVGSVIACHKYIDQNYVSRNTFYNEFSIPSGRRFLLGVEFARNTFQSSILAVHRPPQHGPFEDCGITGMQRLLPHLHRAAVIQQRIAQLQTQHALANAALNSLPIGLLLVDGSARVKACNVVGETFVHAGDGLRLERGRLAADAGSANDRLKSAIRRAVDTAARRSGLGGSNLRVARPSGLRDYVLLVAPLAPDAPMVGTGTACAIILIRDLEQRTLPPVSTLQELFGLTAAEGRLTMALLNGKRLEDVASERDVSMATVRTQLRSTLFKTRTSRQAELVGLLAGIPAIYH